MLGEREAGQLGRPRDQQVRMPREAFQVQAVQGNVERAGHLFGKEGEREHVRLVGGQGAPVADRQVAFHPEAPVERPHLSAFQRHVERGARRAFRVLHVHQHASVAGGRDHGLRRGGRTQAVRPVVADGIAQVIDDDPAEKPRPHVFGHQVAFGAGSPERARVHPEEAEHGVDRRPVALEDARLAQPEAFGKQRRGTLLVGDLIEQEERIGLHDEAHVRRRFRRPRQQRALHASRHKPDKLLQEMDGTHRDGVHQPFRAFGETVGVHGGSLVGRVTDRPAHGLPKTHDFKGMPPSGRAAREVRRQGRRRGIMPTMVARAGRQAGFCKRAGTRPSTSRHDAAGAPKAWRVRPGARKRDAPTAAEASAAAMPEPAVPPTPTPPPPCPRPARARVAPKPATRCPRRASCIPGRTFGSTAEQETAESSPENFPPPLTGRLRCLYL